MSEVRVRIVADTNVGLVRQNNEDNFVVCRDLTTSDWTSPQTDELVGLGDFGSLLVVADGMGGANAGEVASALAVETVKELFSTADLAAVVGSEDDIATFMTDAVKTADQRIGQRSREDASTQGMGTTIVMAWIVGGKAHVCWCGDSRCYVFNPKVGLTRLSKDHSYVQELIDRGELQPELAHSHPYSNVITQCLGDTERRAKPDCRTHRLADGDVLLLCSDGLCGLCDDDQIMETMQANTDDVAVMRNCLIGDALKAGGHDNVTVALCAVETDAADEADGETADDVVRTQASQPARRSHAGRVVAIVVALLVVAAAVLWFFMRQRT